VTISVGPGLFKQAKDGSGGGLAEGLGEVDVGVGGTEVRLTVGEGDTGGEVEIVGVTVPTSP
jgi:hypothetical protein